MDLTDLTHRRVLIMGLGKTGKAAALRFKSIGADVSVTEKSMISLKDMHDLQSAGIKVECGGHSLEFCLNHDMAFISPGIANSEKIIQFLIRQNIPCFDELDWVGSNYPGKIIAVTGTNGKSTTATWVYTLLKENGFNSILCGNIGIPACSTWQQWEKDQWMVIEISSFQAERLKILKPDICLLTNITPNHLDRHGSFIEYIQAKQNLIYRSKKCILNWRDREFISDQKVDVDYISCQETQAEMLISKYYFEEFLMTLDRNQYAYIRSLGQHNHENLMLILAVAKLLGIETMQIKKMILHFSMLPHRMEWVSEVYGRNFYNDSKSTSVGAVIAAIQSVNNPIVLLLGGKNKDSDFSQLLPMLKDKVSHVILFGESRYEILSQISEYSSISIEKNVYQAIQRAIQKSLPKYSIVFSPGCASFDQFSNYKERGEYFIKEILKLQDIEASQSIEIVNF